ncbi:MAG: ABC transporter permease [Eubacterium sp.]|nr:ABC transporter permease [Eubacterium sp.]
MKEKSIKDLLSNNATYVILIVMCIVITVARPKFISGENLLNVFSAACVYGCMALGMTFIIISGGIDLAAGATVAFTGTMGAIFGQTAGAAGKVLPGVPELPFIVPVIISILSGIAIGFITGFLIARFNTPPFIVTLGMTTVVRGFTLLITKGEPVSNLIHGYSVLGGRIGMIPVSVIVFILLILLSVVLLKRTRFGRDTYAIGSNQNAASVSGVKVSSRKISIYVFAGVMYAIAGLIVAGKATSIHPGAAQGYELTAIAACIIGGASPSGGTGTIWSTVIGALIISVLRNGLTLLGIDSYWQQIAEGLVIIIAVALDVRRNSGAK